MGRLGRMIGSRISSGATLSGIPLAAALWAASAHHHGWLVTLGSVALGIILLLTVAPWLPVLHRLRPPLGAPKARITFRQIPQDEHRYPASTVIVEVGVKPTTRLEDAIVNFQFPRERFGHASLHVRDPAGNQRTDGHILPPRDIASDSPILWWSAPADLRAASQMFWFQLSPEDSTQAHTFKVTMVVSSEKLHGGENEADFEVAYRGVTSS